MSECKTCKRMFKRLDSDIKRMRRLQPKDREEWDTTNEWRADLIWHLEQYRKDLDEGHNRICIKKK